MMMPADVWVPCWGVHGPAAFDFAVTSPCGKASCPLPRHRGRGPLRNLRPGKGCTRERRRHVRQQAPSLCHRSLKPAAVAHSYADLADIAKSPGHSHWRDSGDGEGQAAASLEHHAATRERACSCAQGGLGCSIRVQALLSCGSSFLSSPFWGHSFRPGLSFQARGLLTACSSF